MRHGQAGGSCPLPTTLSPELHAAKVRAGKAGAASRWAGHQRRYVRIDELHPAVADAVRALIAADAAVRGSARSTEEAA